jgi:dienelactone hydrolase
MRWLLALVLFGAVADVYPAEPLVRGKIVERISAEADPTQSYAYYLPANYDPESKWPILFVFDPRERGAFAAELFREPAELYGWIIVSSNNSHSLKSTEHNARALQAMWSDAPRRFSIDRRRIYATGFSGGAIMAWWLGRATNMVAGVIGCGGRMNDPRDLEGVTFDWYGIVGDADYNYTEMRRIEQALAGSTATTSRLEYFSGPHRWPPPPRLREAMDWMEVQAIRRGARSRDDDFLNQQAERDLASARRLENNGDLAGAMRAFQNIDRTYGALLDTSAARNRAAELRGHPDVMRALRDEETAETLEATMRTNLSRLLREYVRSEDPHPPAMLSSQLRIAYLKKLSREDSPAGHAAQRVLAMTFVQLNHTVDELVAGRMSERAENVRQVVREIR